MPNPTQVRNERANAYYHVWNRGANQAKVFLCSADFWCFRGVARKKLKLLQNELKLEVFCLLDNHPHFVIKQRALGAISKFIKSVSISYAMYFNKKYDHTGVLFSGTYHSRLIVNEDDLKQTIQYVLDNPREAGKINWPHVGFKI